MVEIENARLVTEVYGRWPTFHDAEVVRIALDRTGPALELELHAFQRTDEVDEAGYLVLRDHRLLTLRFDDIDLHYLQDFNHQNAIYELLIEERAAPDDRGRSLEAWTTPAFGCGMHLSCRRASVVSVEPFAEGRDFGTDGPRGDPRPIGIRRGRDGASAGAV